MADRHEAYESLDLALRIGEVLLSSGAGAADVATTMLAVTEGCGVRHVTADVTFVDLTLHHQPTSEEPAAIQVRRVIRRPVDYAHLIEVDETVNRLVAPPRRIPTFYCRPRVASSPRPSQSPRPRRSSR